MFNITTRVKITLFTLLFVSLIVLVGCSQSESGYTVVRLAVPNNATGVAPIFVMYELNLLENHASNVQLELVVIDSSSARNEAFISNHIDGGAMNTTNFLIGSERGVPYKILASLAYGANSIQTNDPDRIRSLADITENDLIALANPVGSNAIMLYIAAERYFGDHNALANNIAIMDRYSAMLSLINNSSGITLHASNFLERLRTNEAGSVTILEERDLVEGGLVHWYLVFNNDFHDAHPDIMDGMLYALQDAIDLGRVR